MSPARFDGRWRTYRGIKDARGRGAIGRIEMLGDQRQERPESSLRACALAFGSAVLTTGLLACAAPAFAAEPCPNEAIREQQGVTYLPDCRAFEQVTPAHKGANDAVFE